MSFANLKKNSKTALAAVQAELEKMNAKSYEDDSADFWSPTVDKAGNGSATIRFLPPPENEDAPFIRYWDHSFQRNGKWYIERSLTTFNEPDPCAEYNSQLWNSGLDENKELVQGSPAKKIIGSKRRLHYVANVYIVNDPEKPENNGKVKKYRFGKKIFDKIQEAIKPPFADMEAIDPFNLWEGADFKLRIRNKDGYRNYDASGFDKPSVLGGMSDDELEAVWKAEYSLSAELDREKKFKSYEDLAKRLALVLGTASAGAATAEERVERPVQRTEAPRQPRSEAPSTPKTEVAPWDAEDDAGFFDRLANE